jgi:GTP-binding protein
MKIKTAKFVGSSIEHQACPKSKMPEFAFIGRSNVGKSTLINMLTNKKSLAKTSSSPGKTQLINHFFINDNWYLVDLPGYGFAKNSKENRKKWQKMINDYLLERENLAYTFLLIDSRLDLQKSDLEMINWFGEMQIPFGIVYTKADKLTKNKLDFNIENIQKGILKYWEELPTQFTTSAKNSRGKEEILSFVDTVVKNWTI